MPSPKVETTHSLLPWPRVVVSGSLDKVLPFRQHHLAWFPVITNYRFLFLIGRDFCHVIPKLCGSQVFHLAIAYRLGSSLGKCDLVYKQENQESKEPIFVESLLCSRHYANCFTYITSFCSCNKHIMQVRKLELS